MKTLEKITFLLVFAIIFPAMISAQETGGFSITGKIGGLPDGEKIQLNVMIYTPNAIEVPTDSAVVNNGEFRIQGHVDDGPRIYWLRFIRLNKVYRMFIDNGQKINLRYDEDFTKNGHQLMDQMIACDGSPTNQSFHIVWATDDAFTAFMSAAARPFDKIRDSLGYDRNLITTAIDLKQSLRKSFNQRVLHDMNPEFKRAAALFAMYEGQDHDPVWNDVYTQLDKHQQNSVHGKILQKRLALLVGQKMPDFTLHDEKAKDVNLQNIVSKNKLTLVRFWATNSFNRSEFDQELRSYYQQYKTKGLEIIAVSSDNYLEQWKETLASEKYPWLNVVDLKGRKVVDAVYDELGPPERPNSTNVLVDQQGHIVAWDVYGVELKWYLDNLLNPL